MSNPGRMQRRWMCLSEVEQYCLNSLTPQRSEMQKSRPRRTGELASMSASAAESTDCTAAALGAVERFPIDSRLVGSPLRYLQQSTTSLPSRASGCLCTWSWQTFPSSCIPKTPQHGCIQSSRLAAAIGMQAITCEMHSQAVSGVALTQDRESPLFVV